MRAGRITAGRPCFLDRSVHSSNPNRLKPFAHKNDGTLPPPEQHRVGGSGSGEISTVFSGQGESSTNSGMGGPSALQLTTEVGQFSFIFAEEDIHELPERLLGDTTCSIYYDTNSARSVQTSELHVATMSTLCRPTFRFRRLHLARETNQHFHLHCSV